MFNLNEEKSIIIKPNVQEIFDGYRKKLPSKEAGGILLGRVCPNNIIIIEEITEPSKKDKAGFYFFVRNKKTAQEIVNQKWEKSNGELIYIGEWHTHNENHPNPSPRDRSMIKNMLNESVMEIDFLILLIIGIKDNFIGIQRKKKFEPLSASNNPFIYSDDLFHFD